MDFLRSYFRTNEPLTSWTLLIWKKVRTKGFNWSEVHLYGSNFLQDPYFSFVDLCICLFSCPTQNKIDYLWSNVLMIRPFWNLGNIRCRCQYIPRHSVYVLYTFRLWIVWLKSVFTFSLNTKPKTKIKQQVKTNKYPEWFGT